VHRRTLGRGRRLAFLGVVIVLVSAALPWFTLGGGPGELTPLTYNVWDGAGLATLLAALATVAVMTLPYAMVDRPVAVDRGITYGLLAIVGVVGVALWIIQFVVTPEGFLPDRAPGLWVATVGVIVLCRAAYEISLEPPRR
jgi:hypothetical protein